MYIEKNHILSFVCVKINIFTLLNCDYLNITSIIKYCFPQLIIIDIFLFPYYGFIFLRKYTIILTLLIIFAFIIVSNIFLLLNFNLLFFVSKKYMKIKNIKIIQNILFTVQINSFNLKDLLSPFMKLNNLLKICHRQIQSRLVQIFYCFVMLLFEH